MEKANRKHPRLKQYDYSQPGYYYITIHIEKNTPMLSTVIPGSAAHRVSIKLTDWGMIAERQLFSLETRYPSVKIDKYVIMPTHIHAILRLAGGKTEGVFRPKLMDVVCAYKSLTTRACNQASNTPGQKLFQTSFYETVLRNEQAYQECWRYIDENPEKWLLTPEDI